MPITTEKRLKHKNLVEKLKKEIGQISVESRKILTSIEDQQNRQGKYDAYKTISIAFNYLRICERYIELNKSSIKNLNKKSDNDLKEARSNFANAIREMEKWSKQIMDYLTEKDKYMEQLEKFNAARLLEFMKAIHDNVDELYEGFKKTRWWGNVVSLEGQALSSFLYFIPFKEISNPNYLKAFYDQKIQIRMRLIEWIKRVSNNFREKYMLQTRETGDSDIKMAIRFQEDLRRITSVMGEQEETEQARKTIEIWSKMMDKDSEEREKKRNRKR